MFCIIDRLFATNGNLSSSDLASLQDIFDSTNGAYWEWLDSGSRWNFTEAYENPAIPCSSNNSIHWQGIICNNCSEASECLITEIYLPSYNLTGTMSTSISNLSSLVSLTFSNNDLYGDFSLWNLEKLTNLNHFTIASTSIAGTIPTSLVNLVQMTYFQVRETLISGTFPVAVLGWNQTLSVLDLAECYFHGTLPNWFHSFSNLVALDISYNKFNGTLPSTLFSTSLLKILAIRQNKFTGTIPSSISNVATTLRALTVGKNSFEGVILPYLVQFNHSSSGSFLRYLEITYNSFESTIPSNIGWLTAMEYFYIYQNKMTGHIPTSIINMEKLISFQVFCNFFSGPMPLLFSTVQYYSIFLNLFTGTIPTEYTTYLSMQLLDMGNNLISGSIPHSIGNLNQLNLLGFNNNRLTGKVPLGIGNLSVLETLLLQENYFTGSDGNIFTKKSGALSVVDISDNNIRGQLPNSVFLLPNISVISATKNCFTGSLPSTLCHATKLIELELDGLTSAHSCRNPIILNVHTGVYYSNFLAGSIPSCLFTALPLLQTLQLSGNGFTGTLPELNFINNSYVSSLINISVSHNRLTGMRFTSVYIIHYY